MPYDIIQEYTPRLCSTVIKKSLRAIDSFNSSHFQRVIATFTQKWLHFNEDDWDNILLIPRNRSNDIPINFKKCFEYLPICHAKLMTFTSQNSISWVEFSRILPIWFLLYKIEIEIKYFERYFLKATKTANGMKLLKNSPKRSQRSKGNHSIFKRI